MKRHCRFLTLVILAIGTSACIYRIDIQQGNLLEESAIEQAEVGMTKNQIVFLLGTPMVTDSFHEDRWDYTYYLRRGRSREVERRWLIVYFDGDIVSRIEKDVPLDPAS
ncbi:MAG: outer membrane protein assembly factor BamE [Gammaproteobacteria bacterium]|nr:outer membrane protein assembly factor BamE [Gammaproteobacteria bacterium]